MKNIFKYITVALASVALLATSCSKSELVENEFNDGEGSLSLSLNFAQTRSEELSTDALLENSTVKIYKSSGELIRYYSPATDMPEELYLAAGNYNVTVSAGEALNATFAKEESLFKGESQFAITANKSSEVEVNCPIVSSAVRVVYDQSIEETFGDTAVTYVSAIDSFSKEEAVAGDVPTLGFTESGEGYFILPEGVSNISWGFYGDGVDGEISKVGVIETPAKSTLYTLNFKYSKTKGGIVLQVIVDDSTDDFEDEFIFDIQSNIAISVNDFDPNETQIYKGQAVTFGIESTVVLSSVEVTAQNFNNNKKVVLAPFNNGEESDLSNYGIIYTAINDVNGELSLTSDFFSKYNMGGDNTFTIKAKNASGTSDEVSLVFKTNGILPNPVVDLWKNTATISAYVASPEEASEVKISYRRKGATEWVEYVAKSSYEATTFSVDVAPKWNDVKNEVGDAAYILDASAITAASTYECYLSINGVDSSVAEFTTSGAQSIPYGDMEDSGLSCWTTDNANSEYWGSGNNSYAKKLCTFGSYAGMGGKGCAALSGAGVFLVDIAAGNMFTGNFSRPSLSSGKVDFGQSFDWQSRPRTFKVKYAASIGTVDAKYHSGAPLNKGDKDIACIFMAIVDWGDARHSVTSGTKAPTGVWHPASQTSTDEGKIIGYACKYITESTTGDMITLDMPVYYYDREAKPTGKISIVISCATSLYGDYLTGSKSSKLYVDDFELGY